MIWLLLYIIPCIALAKWNAWFITYKVDWANDVLVKHFFNGLFHAAAAVVAWFIFHKWQAPILILLIARLFFDTALNYFKIPRLPFDYVPTTPKSIVDKIEKKVFGKDGYTPKIIYALLIIVLIAI